MKKDARVEVNGVMIYPFTSFEEIVSYVLQNPGILVAINAGKIDKATDQTREIINRNIGYCDGVGAVKALKRYGVKNACKLAGCELWLEIIKQSYKKGFKYYFVGGKQDVIDETIAKLKLDFPGIEIVGYRNGYIKTDEEKAMLLKDIESKKPNAVFVAMGSPKQELLMEEMQQVNPTAVYQGLGGSFDVYTGRFKRAPKWFVEHNMEGPYRIIHDLSKARLIRFKNDLSFLIKLKLGYFDRK